MNNFKRVSAAVLAGIALLCAAEAAHSLGFGRANSRAILGDTLKLSVPLRLEPGEEVPNECVAAEVYFGDDKVPPKAVFTEVVGGEGRDRVLHVSSSISISEPVVTIYLAAGCKSRITRKIVAFPDPPGISVPLAGEASTPSVPDTIEAATLPSTGSLSGVTGPFAKRAVPRSHAVGKSVASAWPVKSGRSELGALPSMAVTDVAAAMDDKPAHSNGASGGKAVSKAKATRSYPGEDRRGESGRLLLDPADADAMAIPTLRMTPSLASTTSADDASPELVARRQAALSIWLALNASPEQMARDRDRLQQLEQRLVQLQQEGAQAQQNVATLKAQIQKADSGLGKAAYLLAALLVGALAMAGYFYQRLRHERGRSESWWQSQAQFDLSEQDLDREQATSGTSADFMHDASGAVTQHGQREAALPQAKAAEPKVPLTLASIHHHVPDAGPSAMQAPPASAAHNEPLREVSVEELIDLEQQAEFFEVLGQDDAAIDLLEGHVQHTTGASPLPFLKLLEIYRRVGKRAEYERVQAEFNQRFNAYAPAWETDLQHGHTLEDYPGVIERLQGLWAEPLRAMAVLEKSITRPESSDDTFELPAYRELLFLYAIARDLSERDLVERPEVDLLLPVPDLATHESLASLHAAAAIEPLMATRPIKALPEVRPSMSLDLQLDDMPDTEPDQMP